MRGKPPLTFTDNQAVACIHDNRAKEFRSMILHFEKWNYSAEEIIRFMRDAADQSEAQALVVDLRDELQISRPHD